MSLTLSAVFVCVFFLFSSKRVACLCVGGEFRICCPLLLLLLLTKLSFTQFFQRAPVPSARIRFPPDTPARCLCVISVCYNWFNCWRENASTTTTATTTTVMTTTDKSFFHFFLAAAAAERDTDAVRDLTGVSPFRTHRLSPPKLLPSNCCFFLASFSLSLSLGLLTTKQCCLFA